MGDRFTSIEQYMGSGNDDLFIASEYADTVNGGAHINDDVDAFDDPDPDGSDGDTISYEKSEEAVTVDLGEATQLMPTDTLDAEGEEYDSVEEERDGVLDTMLDTNPEGSYAAGDVLTFIENVIGSSQDDDITGNGALNELSGGAGDDELTAVVNEDMIDHDGDGGAGGTPTPEVPQSTGDLLMGNSGDDTLTGDTGADTLMGGDGHDTIMGLAGNDRIVGGAGDDVMTGGDGDDIFVFSPADGVGDDTVVDADIDPQNDKIDLSAFKLTEREEKTLMENISVVGENIRIDLSDFGGGTITLQDEIALADLGDCY